MPNTTNYNLEKPLGTDNYDVGVFNDNADKIDAQMKRNADAAASAQSTADNASTTAGAAIPKTDYLRAPEYVYPAGTAAAMTGTTAYPVDAGRGVVVLVRWNMPANATLNINEMGDWPICTSDGKRVKASQFVSGSYMAVRRFMTTWYIVGGGVGGIDGFFGDGRHGELTTGKQYTNSTIDIYPVILQYTSVNLPAGQTVTVGAANNGSNAGAGRNKGLIWLVQGDVTIGGTITQNCKAPLYHAANTFSPGVAGALDIARTGIPDSFDTSSLLSNPALYNMVMPMGGKGGDGGNFSGYYGLIQSALAAGGQGTVFGGGFGGGGDGGTANSSGGGDNPLGGGHANIPAGISMPYAASTGRARSLHGAGGPAYYTSLRYAGGAGPGGGGAGYYATNNVGGAGGAGNAYGGGMFILICGGNVTINTGGSIQCNGGNGGAGGGSLVNPGVFGGGGGGGGGGSIIIIHKGTFTNNGSLQVNGGSGGTNSGGLSASYGQSGYAGTIKTVKWTEA